MSHNPKQKHALDWWNFCISDEKKSTLIAKYQLTATGKKKQKEIFNLWLKEAHQSKK
jgi:hypothetical protein